MKTLHITNCWHANSGGIRTFYQALLDTANAHGHEMRLVVPGARTEVETVGQFGKIYHVQAPKAPFSPSYRILYPHTALLPGGTVNRILAQEKPDLVEICDKYTMNYLGGLLRIGMLPGIDFRPAVVALSCERMDRAIATYLFDGLGVRILSRTYMRWLYFPLADHHIAVSDYVASELREVADGHAVDRGVWIGPMGVDYPAFSSASPLDRGELLKRTESTEDTVLLVYAGRLAPEKNIGLLFGMMEELRRCDSKRSYKLVLVGGGDARLSLQLEAERRIPGGTSFLGHCSDRKELARTLASCDVFLHPNPCEPFGIGPLEAMAAGVAMVGPNSGGITNYANDENSWLAEPNPRAFAKAVQSVLADPAVRARKVQRARESAHARDWPHAAERYLCLYRELNRQVREGSRDFTETPAFFSSR